MRMEAAVARSAAVLMVIGVAFLSAHQAAAAQPMPVPETGSRGDLSLASDPLPISFTDMSPGRAGYAAIDLLLDDRIWADTTFTVATSGPLMERPDGVVLDVRGCDVAWQGIVEGSVAPGSPTPTCSAGERIVLPAVAGAQFALGGGDVTTVWRAGVIRADTPGHLLLALSLPDSGAGDETLMGQAGDFTLRFTAAGDDTLPDPSLPVVPPPPGSAVPGTALGGLAETGVSVAGWALVAAGAVLMGLLAVARKRRLT
jgi:hypothetical protein